MLKKIKNMKNKPIDKLILQNSNYYIPYFINEKEWKSNKKYKWFEILTYNYGKGLFHGIDKNNFKSKYNKFKSKYNICSIDIGCKNFISLYGLDGICMKIKSDYEIIDKILQNKKINYEYKDAKIKHLINELHIISSKLICSKYDIIYVGLVNNKGNIDSKNMKSIEDNLLKIVSHKEFLEKLQVIANQFNKEIRIVEESFTSVQCGVCGEANKFKRIFNEDNSERRKYTCEYCNSQFCRDINASRNILIKNEHLYNE